MVVSKGVPIDIQITRVDPEQKASLQVFKMSLGEGPKCESLQTGASLRTIWQNALRVNFLV
jgi:hypothetical protein